MISIDSLFISPRQRLILGLLFIPAYLLQQSIIIRFIQFTILISLYFILGGRFRIVPNLMLTSGIIIAYIIRPVGKVLFTVAEFPITEGALTSGLSRAFMLIGLIYISRLSVSSKLNFKGTVGTLLGRVFYYFEAITESQLGFHFSGFYKKGASGRLISSIDDLLISIDNKDKSIEKIIANKNTNSLLSVTILFMILILASYIIL